MSTQRTPGPWYAYPNALQVADKHFWFDSDGARHGDTPNIIIECPDIASTHLIAAAPGMREALKSMREYLSKCPPHAEDRTGAEWGRVMDLSGAALAKAEGKS